MEQRGTFICLSLYLSLSLSLSHLFFPPLQPTSFKEFWVAGWRGTLPGETLIRPTRRTSLIKTHTHTHKSGAGQTNHFKIRVSSARVWTLAGTSYRVEIGAHGGLGDQIWVWCGKGRRDGGLGLKGNSTNICTFRTHLLLFWIQEYLRDGNWKTVFLN